MQHNTQWKKCVSDWEKNAENQKMQSESRADNNKVILKNKEKLEEMISKKEVAIKSLEDEISDYWVGI